MHSGFYGVIGNGTHALMSGYLSPYELTFGKWYRSTERVSGKNPHGGYLTNKKWHLNEVKRVEIFTMNAQE